MMKYTLALALMLLAAPAVAEDVVGLHGPSTHFRDGPNNANFGAFVRSDNIEIGTYYNSRRKMTVYSGYMLESNWPLQPAVMVGLASGYGKLLVPYATVSVSYPVAQNWKLRMEYTHDFAAQTYGVLHLRAEYKFR